METISTKQKNSCSPSWGYWLILVHAFGRDCVRLVSQISLCLITLGGDVIMKLGALFKSMTEWGLGDFPGLCAGPRLQGLYAFFN